MRKIDRLFEIVQLLRGKRLRTAEFIAGELGVSVRTIYRDIQGLTASGVPIEGERGIGYVIRNPIDMPPLKFTDLELQALQLGIKMVSVSSDEEIAAAAREASIKIKDVMANFRAENQEPIAHVYFETSSQTKENLALLRDGLNLHKKLQISYCTENNQSSHRLIRPLGLEYWGKVWTLTAWCELRDSFRVFRVDRILSCEITDYIFKSEKGKTYQDYINLMKHKNV